ncbi:peroxiredoxin-like family protein [Niabella beijingensis]|uniref:peroxiredoxin-like family protein n=1 Tax=Niabella beijingensis TaxID=2872700 RepID=UPI001CBBC91C|nr:peroxiredoxin-like family protein [Niabella beijingensis]MBZ4191574.1 AhpC/TSA family protein [Niabella beijingensis]
MSTLIKIVIAAFLSVACSIGGVHAQQHKEIKSPGMNGKMKMEAMPSVIPQRPEDISPLLYGEKIPMAVLPSASGQMVDLSKAISRKPTILVFYRGGWCPYCSRQLSGLQEVLPELEKLGYQLIAISTDTPEGLMQSAQKEKLSYLLLSDADLTLSKQVGIAYKAPKGYWEMLPKTTGGKDADLLLPVPSVFILDRTGTIHFEYMNPNFKQRLSPDLLKAAAASIRKNL